MNDRRWFAGMALNGLIASMTDANNRHYAKHPEELLKLPEAAYALADMMLAQDPPESTAASAPGPGPCASPGTSSPD